jgi:hypothetical protein
LFTGTNIKTGYGGITKVPNDEVVIFVSSLHRLDELDRSFVFSDRHAYLVNADFYSDVSDFDRIDWRILQNRDFCRDPDDPEKMEHCLGAAGAIEAVATVVALNRGIIPQTLNFRGSDPECDLDY